MKLENRNQVDIPNETEHPQIAPAEFPDQKKIQELKQSRPQEK